MKKFTIDISHASPGQLQTIAAELKIMSHDWTKYGPRIMINGAKLQAPSLRIPGSGRKRGPRSGRPQASSLTRPELWDIVGVCLVLLNPNSKKVDLEDKKF